ncbi:MAG: NAD-binding protein [Crocinitomicaceae bacterium]|jgi:voltage-gated potassium channel|nr:NAD-binding protein [Crocinitomicaceae bacterium]
MLFNYRFFYRIYYFVFLLVLITTGGTVGYVLIEGWTLIDAFYMTIITISTVGFSEVGELSLYGKLFTSFLIISSFGTFAYVLSSITKYLVGGEYKKYFKEYKTIKKVNKMEDHVIICGFGRVGKQVAEDLQSQECMFVIIESDQELIEEYSMKHDYTFVNGDATHDEDLEKAGIATARGLITCLPKDADNLYAVLAGREFNSNILIISRASYYSAVSKLKLAGANNIIMPDSIGGSHMASLIVNPDVMEFLDIIRVQGNQGANVESITYEQLPPELQGKTIEELDSKKTTGVTIIGYKTQGGDYQINPDINIKVVPGSKLFVLGKSSQIEHLNEFYGIN